MIPEENLFCELENVFLLTNLSFSTVSSSQTSRLYGDVTNYQVEQQLVKCATQFFIS
jgi:hypothetical protein